MLDNLDGKQARRTGTSSPLGLMFDHGCDALTTFLFTTGLGTILGLGKVNN
jgi:ethanolaminephosphotransferase